MLLVACADPSSEPVESAEPRAAPILPCDVVRVEAVTVPEGMSRPVELTGLLTGLLEWRLASVHGVVPRVGTLPSSPGLQDALLTGARQWTVTVEAFGSDGALSLRGTCCGAEGGCEEVLGEGGTDEHPGPAVDALTAAITQCIGATGSLLDVRGPESTDPYAIVLAGRAAATFYGLLPEPTEEMRGDPRRDVYRRALYIDPTMPLAAWIAGREAHRRGDLTAAEVHLRNARERTPGQLSLVADELATRSLGQSGQASGELIQRLGAGAPSDARFLVVRARTLIKSGAAKDAELLLDRVPPWAVVDPRVAALRVATADALSLPAPVLDQRLAAWADAAPLAQEPVRRRARLAVDQGRLTDALPFADELAKRGASSEARRLSVAIETSLGRFSEAADDALAQGDEPLAAALLARTSQPDRAQLAAAPPAARLAAARALAHGDQKQEAVAMARAAREQWGDHADAWRALADVLRAAGDPGASAALAAAKRLDPDVIRGVWPPEG